MQYATDLRSPADRTVAAGAALASGGPDRRRIVNVFEQDGVSLGVVALLFWPKKTVMIISSLGSTGSGISCKRLCRLYEIVKKKNGICLIPASIPLGNC